MLSRAIYAALSAFDEEGELDMPKYRIGDVVQLATSDSYNGRCGVIAWISWPPPWLPEDGMGYNFFVQLFPKPGERYQIFSWFHRHEVAEAKEVHDVT
jgi:hypothetical protein